MSFLIDCHVNAMSSVTFNYQAEHHSELQLAPRFAPWAYGKGRSKGGVGGSQIDIHGGRYTPQGYESADGEQWEWRAQYD